MVGALYGWSPGGGISWAFERPVSNRDPTIVLYEVYKRVKRERGEDEALGAVAQLKKTQVILLTETIALKAADLSLEHRLAMADAVVYATAQLRDLLLITSDDDFDGLPGVLYLPKPSNL